MYWQRSFCVCKAEFALCKKCGALFANALKCEQEITHIPRPWWQGISVWACNGAEPIAFCHFNRCLNGQVTVLRSMVRCCWNALNSCRSCPSTWTWRSPSRENASSATDSCSYPTGIFTFSAMFVHFQRRVRSYSRETSTLQSYPSSSKKPHPYQPNICNSSLVLCCNAALHLFSLLQACLCFAFSLSLCISPAPLLFICAHVTTCIVSVGTSMRCSQTSRWCLVPRTTRLSKTWVSNWASSTFCCSSCTAVSSFHKVMHQQVVFLFKDLASISILRSLVDEEIDFVHVLQDVTWMSFIKLLTCSKLNAHWWFCRRCWKKSALPKRKIILSGKSCEFQTRIGFQTTTQAQMILLLSIQFHHFVLFSWWLHAFVVAIFNKLHDYLGFWVATEMVWKCAQRALH